MNLSWIDWSFIAAYFVFALGVGIYFSRRAGKSIESFFIAGRSLPWWIAGTSMVATTFGADTPLAVTEIVAKSGISGNWLWWNFLIGGMLTVFFFSRLWRRSEVLTDVEFTEVRYHGRPAALLRGFRALYLGLPINCMIMAWGILAMSSILEVTFSFPKGQAIVICLVIAVIYSVLSGFWGVVITDLVQFIVAMGGSISLAVIAVRKVGGVEALKHQVSSVHPDALQFFPSLDSAAALPVLVFFVYIAVQWWAAWYPGAEPGGGGYVAQRMLASRDERHSILATLWFNIAHYALRPWPWIIVALAALVLFPGLDDPKLGYPKMMVAYLPVGLRGMMLAAFFGAFMSTIDTHLNWGASYIINDFYKRFLKRRGSAAHYVRMSRFVVAAIMAFAGLTAYWMESIKSGWELLLAVGAGTGVIYILRWYWWRINAWSEISGMTASFITAVILLRVPLGVEGELAWAYRMLITVGVTTAVWITVTFLTRPVEKDHLLRFYCKVRPQGIWSDIRRESGSAGTAPKKLGKNFICWISGTIMVYAALFGVGKIIFHEYSSGIVFLSTAAAAGMILFSLMKKDYRLK